MRFYRLLALVGLTWGMAGCTAGAAQAPLENQVKPVPTGAAVLNTAAVDTLTPFRPAVATVTIEAGQAKLPETASPTALSATPEPSVTAKVLTPAPGAVATLDPRNWQDWPVVPELSPRAIAILKDGLAKGGNPHVFSKIGDCESQAIWFLGDFDQNPKNYALGTYQTELAPVIPYYTGSFGRISLAARPGFTSASLLAPIWADKQRCAKDENPLACEYRLNHPAAAFIMLGSNDASNPKTFEGHMRKILDYSIAQGVLPILGTKADNVEGDHFINATIARLANEYGLPLWNYWRAVQPLPDHGLQADKVHLTFGTPRFDDPAMMKKAWTIRNLNAMQILKRVMDQTK